MKRSVIFGVVSLAIVGLLGFVGGRVSNKEEMRQKGIRFERP